MNLLSIADPEDARLSDYVRLRDASLRRGMTSLFIAEGEKVIRRALSAGYRPRSFLLSERWLASLSDVIDPEVPVYLVTEDLAETVTGFHVHRGALGSFFREQRYSMGQLLAARRLVVLEDIVDHTNVGAILRNAAGLGWDGVLLSPRCADPLYRRSIKVAMGTVFSLPWAWVDDYQTALVTLRSVGFRVVGLELSDAAVPLSEFAAAPQEKLAVVLGTEGAGISELWLSQVDDQVLIPMRAGVDSLNVAAASAIACYALG